MTGCILIMLLILIATIIFISRKKVEGFEDNFKENKDYKTYITTLTNMYNPHASAKRPVTEYLKKINDPNDPLSKTTDASNPCFVNFYSLGCRFAGFIGSTKEGYWDPDNAVQIAVNAGCRTFVLDIDYSDYCYSNTGIYYPRLVVRDIKGVSIIKSDILCNNDANSNIKYLCDKINYYAFNSSCQNRTDPVVIVLYFIRQPPGANNSRTVLDYFSSVAKALSPFTERFIDGEIPGAPFYGQKGQTALLGNDITLYNNKVLIFSNADTSGFVGAGYESKVDLNFLVNLQLQYIQTSLGITKKGTGAGVIELASNFTNIPESNEPDIKKQVTQNWTICLSSDPLVSVPSETFSTITKKYGVQCIPILLFDPANKFMFSDDVFKTYSYVLKPKELRYVVPPIVKGIVSDPKQTNTQGTFPYKSPPTSVG